MIFEKLASSSWLLAQSNGLKLWGRSRQIKFAARSLSEIAIRFAPGDSS